MPNNSVEVNGIDYELIKKEIADLLAMPHKYGDEFNNAYKALAKKLEVVVNGRFSRIYNAKYVRAVNVNGLIVDRETEKHCVYIGNKYVGQIYIDEAGNVFGGVKEVLDKYGDEAVFMPERTIRDIEYVYVEELGMMAAASRQAHCSIYDDPYTQATYESDKAKYSDYAKKMSIEANPTYYIITPDLQMIYVRVTDYNYISDISNLSYNRDVQGTGLMEAVKKMYNLDVGVVNVGGNSYVPLDCVNNVKKFVSYKAKLAHKSGKIQNKIDELVAMKEFAPEYIYDRMPHEYNNICSKTLISRVSDTVCVIRWIYNYKEESFDGMRVYIDGKDVYACKKNNSGQFIKVALSVLNQKNFASEYSKHIEMEDMTGTRLQYYASVVNEIPEEFRMTMLVLFLTDVRMEQLVKCGYGPAIYEMLRENTGNIMTTIKNAVKANEDGKNINQWLGINKYQAGMIINYCKGVGDPNHVLKMVGNIKTLFFGNNDISCVDNKVFDEALVSYGGYYTKHALRAPDSWYIITPASVRLFVDQYSKNDQTGMFEKNVNRYLPEFFNMTKWDYHQFSMYRDYIDMVDKLGIRQSVKLYPKTEDDLKLMHDNAMVVFNMQKSKIQKDQFIKALTRVEKLEYENEDFDFCVVLPTGPNDLVIEGVELRHCVKTYVDRVAMGKTNIVFIRKKDEKDKPFFTVEVTNDRVISQVHGLCNRNADTEPDMVEFVSRWARNKRLKVGNINHVA